MGTLVGAELAISAENGRTQGPGPEEDASSFQEGMGGQNELHFSG